MTKPTIEQFDFENRKTNLGFEIVSIERIRKIAKQMGYKPHHLNFYQILYFTDGVGEHEVDFTIIPVKPNTVIPVSMKQVQRFIHSDSLQGYAILFTPEFLINEEMDYRYLYEFISFNHSIGTIPIGATAQMNMMLQEMVREQGAPDAFDNSQYQRNLLRNFLILMERVKRGNTAIVCNDSLGLYLRFRNLLENKISYKTRVSDLCDELHVTPKQMNSAMKLFSSETAKQYIDNRVILEIKRLLTYSSLTIKEIAYEVGFDDPTNFTKYFKARTNQLPSAYQKTAIT